MRGPGASRVSSDKGRRLGRGGGVFGGLTGRTRGCMVGEMEVEKWVQERA